jgi:hypothetical protein
MITLNVLKNISNIAKQGILKTDDIEFARQLKNKGLAELIDGEIPEQTKREKPTPTKTNKKG